MKTGIIILILAFGVACPASKSEKRLQNLAYTAFVKGDLNVSLALYRQVALDPLTDADAKSDAFEKISFIFSQFYQQYDSAIYYLLKAPINAHHYCLVSGYLILLDNFPEALELDRKALQVSVNYKDSMESSESFATAALKYCEHNLRKQEPIDPVLVSEAWDRLFYCHHNEPESPAVNEKRLETAFLLKQGKVILQCWKDYFLIQKDDFPATNLREAYSGLESVLKDWNGEQLDQESNRKIILALSQSRFYPLIENLQSAFPIERSYETGCVLAFCKYRDEMENHIYAFYRDIALHKENQQEFQTGIRNINLRLWSTLFPDNHNYSESVFRRALLDRFGTLLYFHTKGRIQVYFGGSAVIREVRPFEQYGHRADFNFSQIDFIFGNAYDFWYLNQGFRIGGWDENGDNSHFRRNVLTGPIWVWNERAKNQDLLNKWKNEIKGLDPHRPLLCQVDQLTEEQIRNIARSLDPLYTTDK